MTNNQKYIYGAYISTLSEKTKLLIKNEIIVKMGLLKNVNIIEINTILGNIEEMRLKDFEFLVDVKSILKKF